MTKQEAYKNLYGRDKRAHHNLKEEEYMAVSMKNENPKSFYNRFCGVINAYEKIGLLTFEENEAIKGDVCKQMFP